MGAEIKAVTGLYAGTANGETVDRNKRVGPIEKLASVWRGKWKGQRLVGRMSTDGSSSPSEASDSQVIGGLINGEINFVKPPKEVEEDPSSAEGQQEPFNTEQEIKHTFSTRPIESRDIDTMVDEGWFYEPRRMIHLRGDTINDKTLPKSWNDKAQVARFKRVLKDFYFPRGEFFNQPVLSEAGVHVKDVRVRRRTLVVEKDGFLAGTTSWLEGEEIRDEDGKIIGMTTGDPWAKPDEPPASHTQMHLIKTEFSGQGLGLFLAIVRTEAIFKNTPYNKIVTWVNTVGDYQANERLFDSMGYEEQGKEYLNTTVPGERVKMRRFELDRENWNTGGVRSGPDLKPMHVGRAASIARWEKVKREGPHRQPNLG